MIRALNITKHYFEDTNIQETFSKLDKIISISFFHSKYYTFGNFVSVDPPEFILMPMWFPKGPLSFNEIFSTKISVTLFKIDNKTKITILTKSNPGITIVFILFVAQFFYKLLTYTNWADIKLAGMFLLYASLTLLVDRYLKVHLIACFEKDIKAK